MINSNNLPPVFMFGFERSGTTLLSMMVGAHPQIAVPLTVTGLWYRYSQTLSRYGELATRSDIERLVTDLLAEERIRLWDVELHAEDILKDLAEGSYAAVIERFHQAYAWKKGKPLWGNLDIATLDEMDVANGWFPRARFLHIVRDGRDVALSHETMPYGASNTLECAERWAQRLRVNMKMGAILGPDRYQIVRYEDLIINSESTLKRICAFIGVPYSPAMLDYPAMVESKVPKDRRWLWPVLDKAPDRSKAYGWKTRMSGTQRIVFEGAAKRILTGLGYEAFETVPKRPVAYLYELWCFLGRGGRFRRLAQKAGFSRESELQRQWRKIRSSQEPAENQAHFSALVQSGDYGIDFQHPEGSKAFFHECIIAALAEIKSDHGISILDAGCGPGAWLDYLCALESEDALPIRQRAQYFGFDITPDMVEVARRRTSGRIPEDHIVAGSILTANSYWFGRQNRMFQVIYTYDVVQQLPRKLQRQACSTLLSRLAPGGVAVIFDNDAESSFGRKMALKKFITRYLGIRLVPPYYCNARYPTFSRLARELAENGNLVIGLRTASDGKKHALLLRSAEARASSRGAEHAA